MRVARNYSLDVMNMGFGGAARGEIPVAEAIGQLESDVISLAYGTNCWMRIPHSTEMIRAGLEGFLDVLRVRRPETPVVVVSPIRRVEAESQANVLGATHRDIRHSIEEVVRDRIARGESKLHLIEGLTLVSPDQVVDGVHPGAAGHAAIADIVGPVLAGAAAAGRRGT
jgi:lysophospholipase L1-like esterase